MKSPKPNKGQCFKVTERLMKFHLLRGTNLLQVKADYAMSDHLYSPTRDDYKWSYALNYMLFNQAVVIRN